MPKRKREDDLANTNATSHDYRRQRQIVHAFDDSANKLARAFKNAKGFERQKLGRRRKQAASEKADGEHEKGIERIDAEITALKTLDLTLAAEHYLAKSLLKVKAVATSSTVLPGPVRETWSAKATAAQTDPATLNVTARICNSRPVKEAFPSIWAGITRELGVEVEEAAGPGRTLKKKRLRAKDYSESQDNGNRDGEASELEDMEQIGVSDGHSKKARTNGNMEDSEDEFAEFKGRLAASSEDGSDGGDVEDVDELERQLEAEGISRKANVGRSKPTYDLAEDLSLSENQSDSGASSPELQKSLSTRKSAFLPSLTMGGYISGSGSDIDDDEVETAPRKNRRGQRARQQIWEKKYGTNAKHLSKQDRKKGWDSKRGATNGSERGKKGHATPRSGRRAGAMNIDTATGANASAVQKTRKRDDTGSLHPSWQAAKRAKELKSAQIAFQGKKISFE